MSSKFKLSQHLFLILLSGILISAGCLYSSEAFCSLKPDIVFSRNTLGLSMDSITATQATNQIKELNATLKELLIKRDFKASALIIERITRQYDFKSSDDETLSESYYLFGVYNLLIGNTKEGIRLFNLCVSLKDKNQSYDDLYANALFNIGVLYNKIGDFQKLEDYSIRSLEIEKKIYGEESPRLINTYLSLTTAYIELQEYDKSLNFANLALKIANKNLESDSLSDLAYIYYNLGVLYSYLADYSKAKIYFDKSESEYKQNHISFNDNYINLMNGQAITYGALGFTDRSVEYYDKGISMALSNNSPISYNIVYSYAIILANSGNEKKGEELLLAVLDRAKAKDGDNSRNYFEVLRNYADYLRGYSIDNKKSLEYYAQCVDYLRKNDQDRFLKTSVYTGYSLSLIKAGDPVKALEVIQSLLVNTNGIKTLTGQYDNPDIEALKPDRISLTVLETKYKILWELYRITPDIKILKAASQTSELIVSLLDKVRINISEEESRLVLGDRYRASYINAIRDYNLLYKKTADRALLEKAFEYSEKSKVAGLLASTRELKAVQFHIPINIAEFERNLQREISLCNARISDESNLEYPDTVIINNLNENLLKATRTRDSLILVFEQKFPEYYALKYNTKAVSLNNISDIIGKDENYINYIVSDTLLYVFVANRKNQQLLAIPVDSSFLDNIRKFRKLLLMPSPSENASVNFKSYQETGYDIYKTLIEPVKKYLISDELLISPDNILSYIPFEALPTSIYTGKGILYRNLHYLMNDFKISYTYSATFMAESVKRDNSLTNNAIVFAPDYTEPVDIRFALLNRQATLSRLSDLPYARQEAEYVSDITGGKLYLNNAAQESVFKSEAGGYDIIHLAMHTILNDKDPMNSTLIFSSVNDTTDDRYLKTYEVYGIPLKAKMVVLSSCNTGSGILSSGEGILSLARGFMYSGSQSVVMSMWEIEDRSGTEIIEKFYDNLKKGKSKNVSLRKARIDYLKNADQLRSHPYFWATLVIYGSNAPLYISKNLIIVVGIAILLIAFLLILYLRRRRYS